MWVVTFWSELKPQPIPSNGVELNQNRTSTTQYHSNAMVALGLPCCVIPLNIPCLIIDIGCFLLFLDSVLCTKLRGALKPTALAFTTIRGSQWRQVNRLGTRIFGSSATLEWESGLEIFVVEGGWYKPWPEQFSSHRISPESLQNKGKRSLKTSAGIRLVQCNQAKHSAKGCHGSRQQPRDFPEFGHHNCWQLEEGGKQETWAAEHESKRTILTFKTHGFIGFCRVLLWFLYVYVGFLYGFCMVLCWLPCLLSPVSLRPWRPGWLPWQTTSWPLQWSVGEWPRWGCWRCLGHNLGRGRLDVWINTSQKIPIIVGFGWN